MCIFLLILSIKNAEFLMIHLDSYHLEKDPDSSKGIKVIEHLLLTSKHLYSVKSLHYKHLLL